MNARALHQISKTSAVRTHREAADRAKPLLEIELIAPLSDGSASLTSVQSAIARTATCARWDAEKSRSEHPRLPAR